MLDMARPARQILGDNNLVEIFINQLDVRMNGSKKLNREKVTVALEVLAD
jgi:hypothetical protein